ncbi:MAG: hypothetical protein IGBAC_0722 [Ignavibacteriae bacterium]|nr:MAG: hypothetical protein IGBAC_0722 [Ignavibacteriota bacterium]
MKYFKILLILFLSQSVLHSQNADDILKKAEKKYNVIKDAIIEFTQINVFGVSKIENKFDGKLWMKKNNKYKIVLENQTIVTNGKIVWSYYPLNNQVIIDDYKDEPESFSPDKIMVNVPLNYNAILIGTEKLFNKNTFVIKLTPRNERSLIKSMKVWLNKEEYFMEKVEIVDVSDNITTYISKSITINAGLKDEIFQFSIPQGVEVLDLRKNSR